MKILIGSQNPVKIKAAQEAFSKYFDDVEVIARDVDSKVSDQPVGDQTFEGAENRVLELEKISKADKLEVDFFVGIEGGITRIYSKWFAFGAVCIIDKEEKKGFGISSHFELPKQVVEELLEGKELGQVMDEITGEENNKQKRGAVGFFTRGEVNRKMAYTQGLILALVPFLNKELYF